MRGARKEPRRAATTIHPSPPFLPHAHALPAGAAACAPPNVFVRQMPRCFAPGSQAPRREKRAPFGHAPARMTRVKMGRPRKRPPAGTGTARREADGLAAYRTRHLCWLSSPEQKERRTHARMRAGEKGWGRTRVRRGFFFSSHLSSLLSLSSSRDQKIWLAFPVRRRGATYELAMLGIRVDHWGKAPHFPRGREEERREEEEERKGGKREGGGGAHSLSLSPHAPVLVPQHAPSCLACVMGARLVRMWGPSIRRRPPRPSAAGPTNRPRPAEHAPPGTKAASDSGRDRGLQFPRPWGSRNTITRGRHRCLRGPPSHPPAQREGGGRRRENLGRFIYGQEGKGGGERGGGGGDARPPPPPAAAPPSIPLSPLARALRSAAGRRLLNG